MFCSVSVGCGARLAVGCLLETEVNRKSFKNKLHEAKFYSCLSLGNSTSTQVQKTRQSLVIGLKLSPLHVFGNRFETCLWLAVNY